MKKADNNGKETKKSLQMTPCERPRGIVAGLICLGIQDGISSFVGAQAHQILGPLADGNHCWLGLNNGSIRYHAAECGMPGQEALRCGRHPPRIEAKSRCNTTSEDGFGLSTWKYTITSKC